MADPAAAAAEEARVRITDAFQTQVLDTLGPQLPDRLIDQFDSLAEAEARLPPGPTHDVFERVVKHLPNYATIWGAAQAITLQTPENNLNTDAHPFADPPAGLGEDLMKDVINCYYPQGELHDCMAARGIQKAFVTYAKTEPTEACIAAIVGKITGKFYTPPDAVCNELKAQYAAQGLQAGGRRTRRRRGRKGKGRKGSRRH
jgi:hypothetical protein